ncbi:PREDICTED: uncharacterized protein LOC108781856 [Cyphomyrmex costatus]|uniref:uncharacterized protein LOC108781856 n=2 Tax=Cyphomyrmex costatus TaxID=456900 RepID=UPI0008522642|nr:PREDICTED: uncharacterized protein LOC108781856 [Cyphomyrmex costatus]
MWVRPIFTQLQRHLQGDSDNLAIEMQLQDQEMFYNYCRMSTEICDQLLSIVEPLIEKQNVAPPHNGLVYYNYKGTHSINLLAVSDAYYCFTLVDIGAEGRQSDGGIFANSKFGQRLERNEMNLPQPSAVEPNGPPLPYVLVADEAFALKSMDRERLDGLSYEQLRDELIKLKLPVTASRTDCLDRLLTYYERYYDCESGAINEVASGSQTIARPSQSVDNVSSVRSATTMEEMQQSVTFIMQQMQRQQQLIERIANAVTSAESGTRNAPPSTSVAPTNQQSPIIISSSSVRNSMDGAASMDNNRHINVFPPLASASPAQAVKLLANQISVFSGTEDDDVEVWIRKVERVASIHGVQDGVTLLAASSKLTKNAREWFDLDDGQINDSWFSFKNAIIKRFKRSRSHTIDNQWHQ